MPKNLFQDMVRIKNERRALQMADSSKVTNISVKIKKEEPEREVVKEIKEEREARETRYKDSKPKKASYYKFWLVALVSIVFLFFALSYFFTKVEVTVNPKVQDLVLNENLVAEDGSSRDVLPFDLVSISGEENKMFSTTSKKDVSQSAKGVAVIYNTLSFASQVLDIDTRLEGSNGKMYKTVKKITVPGVHKDGSPGSVEVGIYASVAGSEYNSSPLDFKIFGFKGTSKYSKFYGRSKGSITGGLKGEFPFISDKEKETAISDMKLTLQQKLQKKVIDQIPEGFILFKDAAILNIEESSVDPTLAKDGSVPIKVKGTLYGFLFDEEKLTKEIAANNIKKYDGSDVYLPNIKELIFSMNNKENTSFKDVKNISFNISGQTKIVWRVDTVKLKKDLIGKSKKSFNEVLSQYPNIATVDLVVSPFWKRSIPEETEKIKVVVNYP